MHVDLFPDNLGYNVYWDDCVTKRGGCALLAVSKRLICEDQPDLKSDSNISWVKITIKGIRSIYVPLYTNQKKVMRKAFQNLRSQSKG